MNYQEIFKEAEGIITQREQGYGDARTLHKAMADRWTGVIGLQRLGGTSLSAYEAARMMAELKAARLDVSHSDDSLLDQINYLVIALAIKRASRGDNSQTSANKVR